MAGLDRTSFNKAFKELYLPPLRDSVNRATVGLDTIKNGNLDIEGRNFIVPLITRKHGGVTSRSGASKSANKLPTASAQKYEVATFGIKYHYGRIEIDGPTMRSSKSDKGSFARALDAEMKGLTRAMPQDLNRQLYGDGTNALAVVTTSRTSTTTVTVDSTKFLEVGQPVSILVHADGTAITTNPDVTISSIDSATQFTASLAVTTTGTTHAIFSERDATAGATPYRNALTGLRAIVNNTNITNMGTSYVGLIDRSSNAFWNANVKSNGGVLRPVTIGLMQQAIIASRQNKYGGTDPKIILTNGDLWSTVGALLVTDKRFRGDQKMLDGGWTALEMSGLNILWDKDAPDDIMFFLDTDHLFWGIQSDFMWMDEDGAILHRVPDYDSYEAVLFCDKELATDMPAAHTLLSDLDVNVA